MKSSSNMLKAARIIAKLATMYRNAAYLKPEDIISKVKSKAELDYYYRFIVGGKD